MDICPNCISVRTEQFEPPERPIEDWAIRFLSTPPTTHSSAVSQPVSSLIHRGRYPATLTGTQNASLQILIGSVSHFARLGLQFVSKRTLPAAKSICTIRPRKKSAPTIPSTEFRQQSLRVRRSMASTDFGKATQPDAASKSFT